MLTIEFPTIKMSFNILRRVFYFCVYFLYNITYYIGSNVFVCTPSRFGGEEENALENV